MIFDVVRNDNLMQSAPLVKSALLRQSVILLFFIFLFFSLSSTFLIEGALGSKNLFRES